VWKRERAKPQQLNNIVKMILKVVDRRKVIVNLAMTMAMKSRYPAATAELIATLSAHTHRGYDAFSTLQPAHDALITSQQAPVEPTASQHADGRL